METFRQVILIAMAIVVGICGAFASADVSNVDAKIPIALGIAYAAIRIATKWYATNKAAAGSVLEKLLKCVILAVGISLLCLPLGCAHLDRQVHEIITDPDGTVNEWGYEFAARAAPFGKIDSTIDDFEYRFGGVENIVRTGQQTTGMDNTGQIEALSISMQGLKDLVPTLADAILSAYTMGFTAGSGTPITELGLNLLDRVLSP